jgi:hypothetical protein
MVDGRGNIDLVFRNGLKDFEVLPPEDMWESIKPSVHSGKKAFPLLKAAASVAVIATLSFTAYRWGMEVTENKLADALATYQEPAFLAANEPFNIVKPAVITLKGTAEKNADIAATPVIVRENAIEEINPDNSGKVVTEMLVADNKTMPGIQDPFRVKYPRVSIPTYQPLNYDELQDNAGVPVMERWSLSALASPTYSSQFTSSGNQFAQQVIQSDQSRISYTGGLGLAYKITSRFTIQSGIFYSSMDQELGGVNAYSGFQQYDNSKSDHNFEVVTANGTVITNNSDVFLNSFSLPERIQSFYSNDVFDPVKANLSYVSSKIYQDLSFLELPVVLRYKILDKKIGVNLIGGMSYNFLVNNSVYAMVDGGKYPVGTTQGLNTVYLSSSVGMGMEYSLAKNFSLNLEPTFRYYLNPINSGGTSVFHPYSLGIFSGLSYRF